jgi:hypothetical protein
MAAHENDVLHLVLTAHLRPSSRTTPALELPILGLTITGHPRSAAESRTASDVASLGERRDRQSGLLYGLANRVFVAERQQGCGVPSQVPVEAPPIRDGDLARHRELVIHADFTAWWQRSG